MTILTFTTVGYDEVRPLSSAGRVFNMFMMVVGVGVHAVHPDQRCPDSCGGGDTADPVSEAKNEIATVEAE